MDIGEEEKNYPSQFAFTRSMTGSRKIKPPKPEPTPSLEKRESSIIETENCVEVPHTKTEEDRFRIRKTLSSHFYFKDLRAETINALIE